MVTLILISHVLYGGFIHLFTTKKSNSLFHYSNLYNWLDTGIVYNNDLDEALRTAIAWCVGSFLYLVGYGALLYFSLNIL